MHGDKTELDKADLQAKTIETIVEVIRVAALCHHQMLECQYDPAYQCHRDSIRGKRHRVHQQWWGGHLSTNTIVELKMTVVN